jgi:hypothetical protein
LSKKKKAFARHIKNCSTLHRKLKNRWNRDSLSRTVLISNCMSRTDAKGILVFLLHNLPQLLMPCCVQSSWDVLEEVMKRGTVVGFQIGGVDGRGAVEKLVQGLILIEKNANLVYKVIPVVRFGHKLANREFWITKLPSTSVLVYP